MARYFDSHVHLSDPHYARDMGSILRGMGRLGIRACCVSTSTEDSLRTLDLAGRSDLVLPFVGIHPERAAGDSLDRMAGLIRERREDIAGIGEIGLDPAYARREADARRQADVFETLLGAAERLGKPVSIHSRGSIGEILQTLTSYGAGHVLLHWFDGSKRHLRQAMDMGLYVSYGPVAVYANDKRALMARTDESRILVETDGPVRFSRCFEGMAGQVSFIPSVVFCASKALGRSFDDTAALLERNSRAFLGI